MWFCGPDASRSADGGQRVAHWRAMPLVALAVFRRGHAPILGAQRALPLIAAAGADDA